MHVFFRSRTTCARCPWRGVRTCGLPCRWQLWQFRQVRETCRVCHVCPLRRAVQWAQSRNVCQVFQFDVTLLYVRTSSCSVWWASAFGLAFIAAQLCQARQFGPKLARV